MVYAGCGEGHYHGAGGVPTLEAGKSCNVQKTCSGDTCQKVTTSDNNCTNA